MINLLRLATILSLISSVAQASNIRTLDGAVITNGAATITLPTTTQTVSGNTTTATLTNKTMAGDVNTFSKLPTGADQVQETPSGSVNDANTSFTLANTPPANSAVVLTLDGLLLTQGAGKDYTISGATITMATAPATGQILWAVYHKY